MARRNKTEYAVLGLLSLDPMSGYDMKAFVSQSIGYFWQESYGQIYPTLRKLLREKLVMRKIQAQAGRPDRHVYHLTDAGKKKLTEWLAEQTDPEPVRNELLLKLFFGHNTDPQNLIGHVERLMEHQQRLGRIYTSIRKENLAEHTEQPFHTYGAAILRFGEHVARARVRWCKETLAALHKLENPE